MSKPARNIRRMVCDDPRSFVMNVKSLIAAIVVAAAVAFAPASRAQTTVSEDFTGTTTNDQWFFFNGACLTAGTNTSTSSPGYVPACTTVLQSYYNPQSGDTYLSGGANGYLGSSTAPSSLSSQVADPAGSGALRFTNGYPYGYNERGAIVSASTPFPTGSGVQITFKTVTYRGDSGGAGGDGADGISFYLLDGCMPITGAAAGTGSGVPSTCTTNPIYGTGQTFPAIGAFGGSLAYTCSNSNYPHDGLVGAYLGLGIDEYGNFLNGYQNTLNETGSSGGGYGDNTATGGLYQPGRIGLRGAGSVSWQALNTAYGTYTGASNPYYPSTLSNVCSSGSTYYSGNGQCASCSSGSTYNSSLNQCISNTYSCSVGQVVGTNCESCPAGATLNTSTGMCNNICPSGSSYISSGSSPGCYSCSSYANTTLNYSGSRGYYCRNNTNGSNAGSATPLGSATSATATTTPATQQVTTPSYASGQDLRQTAVQNTCQTGNLFNYSNASSPVSVGAASLSNSVNTAGILDYAAIGNTVSGSATGYSVLSGISIANESATTRGQAIPIVYSLRITQDGLLSLSYNYNGGTWRSVIKGQSITATNGPLPQSFRFGFAGSTGGSTNVHEILCFKASPVETSSSSGGVNVYQNPTIKTGTQVFFAYYFPGNWTGQLTAQSVGFNTTTNSVVITTTPTWDARCVLTGVNSTTGACSTGSTSMAAEAPSSRVMLTWDPVAKTAIPFEWGNLSTAMQNQLDAGDSSSYLVSPYNAQRLSFLRGDRTQEITSSGSGRFRARDAVLSDIVDSSPTWIGPPSLPYTNISSWVDTLYPGSSQPENGGSQTYAQFQSANQARLNVVYVGANDGFLHGFRAGSLDSNGNLVTGTSTPNDGSEVLAYMPGAVFQTIHNSSDPTLDFANTQYSHNFFVDATPAMGDVYYSGAGWQTWVIGGLGAGGSAIYALDVTNPANFAEANAAYNFSTTSPSGVVIGEWTPSTITCVNVACGSNLGNTFGQPQIRRFHNGQWGAIIGNGVGSTGGTAGVYIMLINSNGSVSFYYLASGSTATSNGIVEAASADFDGDHIVDYIYAGDLQGNVWRFDVTSNNPANWGSPFLLFTTPGGSAQPITTRVTVGTLKTVTTTTNAGGAVLSNGPERVMINFGTGWQIPQTTTSAAQYASGQQYLFGIWDWNVQNGTASWNSISSGQKAVGLNGPETITLSNLQVQTITSETAGTSTTTGTRSVSHNTICFLGDSTCSGGTSLGWYLQLKDTNEQVIYDPTLSPDGEFVVNTFVPANNSVLSCTQLNSTGWSMGLNPVSGAGSPTAFFSVGTVSVDGVQSNGTGIPSFVYSGQTSDNNSEYMITQSSGGNGENGAGGQVYRTNTNTIVTGQRLNWIERR